jgi:hypothetical protein
MFPVYDAANQQLPIPPTLAIGSSADIDVMFSGISARRWTYEKVYHIEQA